MVLGTELGLRDRANISEVIFPEIMILTRSGSGFLGRDSHVFLPIIQGQPFVNFEKCAMSFLSDQGIALFLPITRFSAIAVIIMISRMNYTAISNFIAG